MADVAEKCLAVVRLRGTVNVRKDVKDTLTMLHLTRPNNATLIPSSPTYLGMLQLIKDYVTWGEISKETLAALVEKRGEVRGGSRLGVADIKAHGFKSMKGFVGALYGLKVKLTELKGIKPVYRLHPPSKGFKRSLKHNFGQGGELGYRGEKINELIGRML